MSVRHQLDHTARLAVDIAPGRLTHVLRRSANIRELLACLFLAEPDGGDLRIRECDSWNGAVIGPDALAFESARDEPAMVPGEMRQQWR